MTLGKRIKTAIKVLTYHPQHTDARYGYASGVPFTGSLLKGSLTNLYPSKYLLDYDALRTVSRRNYFESTHARSMVGRIAGNAVGTGLKLSCTPTWELLPASSWTEEQRAKFTREVETRFFLWAMSHQCDARGKENLFELQQFEFRNRLKDGETFVILRYSGDSRRISPLSVQFVNPDQIYTTLGIQQKEYLDAATASGNYIQDGIEFNSLGEEVAIYIQDEDSLKVSRIPVSGKARRFVLHPAIIEEIGQVRGVSPVAMLAHELSKITDYSVAEVEAAVNNALIAGYVKPSSDSASSNPFGALAAKGAIEGTDSGSKPTKVEHAGMFFANLKAGEDLQSYDTKRPNVNFGAFVDTVIGYCSASLDIPVEVLKMTFNANYSASRAALIMYWKTVEGWRLHNESQFLQPIYEAWFREEVVSGRINAPDFGNTPILTAAWLTTDWIGDSMPSIDPKGEADADSERLSQGATTYERNALKYNGSDYRDNCEKQKKEKEILPVSSDSAKDTPTAIQKENKNGASV